MSGFTRLGFTRHTMGLQNSLVGKDSTHCCAVSSLILIIRTILKNSIITTESTTILRTPKHPHVPEATAMVKPFICAARARPHISLYKVLTVMPHLHYRPHAPPTGSVTLVHTQRSPALHKRKLYTTYQSCPHDDAAAKRTYKCSCQRPRGIVNPLPSNRK